ncbi:DNA repair protein REV1 [Rhizoctonia solani]|uniref:DNA repair protein REV1 n=1 Tax=Rhizoctonia solani TaxID=456999 RepID=A0A8H8P6Z3_9AGAM|nr:DNA repair protein REV1 [Rhizoctonia solani]QRW26746.1 DNA repair protein REV1 [Rhizoctonia solani]
MSKTSGSRSPNRSVHPIEKNLSQSSDYFDDDPEFSKALATLDESVLFGSQRLACIDNVYENFDEENGVSEPRPSSQSRKRQRSLTPAPEPENSQEGHAISSSGSGQQASTLDPQGLTTSTSSWNSILAPVTPTKTSDTYHASKFGEFGDYFRRKRAKLQNQNADLGTQDTRSTQSTIFKSLAIYITGRTVPSLQILRSLILQYGGQFHAYLDRKEMVTHVITSNLTPAKALEFKNMKVARPEWLLDSIAANKLLPWAKYQWSESYQSSSPIQSATPRTPALTLSIRPLGASPEHSDTISTTLDSPLKQLSNNYESLPRLNQLSRVKPLLNMHLGASTSTQSSRAQYAIHAANPDAERLMESVEWREMHTAASGEAFIQDYYQHSRLHHLSKWKSELRSLVAKAQEDAESQFLQTGSMLNPTSTTSGDSPKGKGKATQRVIMHCDFDSFFVSAGLIARPELSGKPVVVCHASGKGASHSTSEVASASYAARAFGVRNGMSLGQARKLCPEIQTIPYEFERYKELSLKFYTVLMSLSDDLQAVSVDEALIDVSTRVESLRTDAINSGHMRTESYEKALAEMLRDQVREQTGCEVSVGIGPNIMLARLATKRAKPAGSFYLSIDDAPAHLAELDIVNIHGFAGAVQDKALARFGTSKLGDLAKQSKIALQQALGDKSGERIWNAIRGIDDRVLESDKPRKSVSADVNYGIRFENNQNAEAFVLGLAKEVSERLRRANKVGKSLTLKIMKRHPDAPKEAPKASQLQLFFMGHGKCETFNKTCAISGLHGSATNDPDIIGREAWKLLHSMHFDPCELRGIGIQIQKLDNAEKSVAVGIAIHGQLAKGFHRALAKANAIKTRPAEVAREPQTQDIDVRIAEPDAPALTPRKSPSQHPKTTGKSNGMREDPRPVQSRALAAEVTIIDVDALATQDPAPGAKELPYDLTMLSQLDGEMLADIIAPESGCSRSLSAHMPDHPATNSKAGPISPRRTLHRKRFTNMGPPTTLPDPSKYFPIFKRQFATVPDQELVVLGIDPMAYTNMPRDQQKALVSSRRAAKGLDANGRPINQRKRRFVEDAEKPVHHVILAGRTELPTLRAAVPGIPAVTETSDVQDMIRLWVETKVAKKLGPDPREITYFGEFLERSMVTDSGMQRTVEVMKWWKDVCMKSWGIEHERRGQFGREWWIAWWEVKDKLDLIVKKRFGGKLNLG